VELLPRRCWRPPTFTCTDERVRGAFFESVWREHARFLLDVHSFPGDKRRAYLIHNHWDARLKTPAHVWSLAQALSCEVFRGECNAIHEMFPEKSVLLEISEELSDAEQRQLAARVAIWIEQRAKRE
jgi:hypothetical protein